LLRGATHQFVPKSLEGAARFGQPEISTEGVLSEPFLPSGDQGHKGGFTTPIDGFSQNAHLLSITQQSDYEHAYK